MSPNIRKIINEEIERFLLKEYMAVWRDDAITQLSIQIANDFAPLNMQTNINRDKVFKANYSLFLGDKEIPILVTYKIRRDGTIWNGAYHGLSKDIVLHLYGKITASNVLSGLYHEITHALDADREEKLKKKIGYYFGKSFILLNVRSATCDVVNRILYRLWTFTERNAYQSQALFGIKFCQSYINELKEDIDYLTTHTNKNEDIIFNYLKEKLAKNSRLKYANWKTFKRFFIKKSYALLENFSKKLINNAYKAKEEGLVVTLEPNENSEIFAKFKKENDSVEKKIMKAKEEQQHRYEARVNNAIAFLKQFMTVEDEEIEKAFQGILYGIERKNSAWDENKFCIGNDKNPTSDDLIRYASSFCHDLLFDNEGILCIRSRIYGYNKNYYLIFEDDNGNNFVIEDYNKHYGMFIYSNNVMQELAKIAANCIIIDSKGSFYDCEYNIEKMVNEVTARKENFISMIKDALNSLYGLLIKHEYTLTIKLKDREVNLSAPTQGELVMKLRNEFPKWSDSVINNWVSKATLT